MRWLERAETRHLIGLALASAVLWALLATASDLGFARDEGFYYRAALQYQGWFEQLWDDPAAAFERDSVSHHWRYNHEHPALMKVLFGFSHRLFYEELGWLPPSTALRLPGMVAAALCVYLTVLFGWRLYGPLAGVAAGVLLAAQPRFFFHGHLACFDVPVTAAWLATLYAYFRSQRGGLGWSVLSGVVFGLCLCTKLNAFFLPPLLLAHHLIARWLERRRGERWRPLVPQSLWAMAAIGPLVFFLHWPWIWYDTLERVGFYLGFHRHHPYYNMEYFGRTYFRPPLPMSFPFVMTAVTVPATTLLAALIGAGSRLARALPTGSGRRLGVGLARKLDSGDLLVGLALVVPMAIIAWPTVPIFGGTKHWLPAMPALAMLAGLGLSRVVQGLASGRDGARGVVVSALCLALTVAPAVRETVASHPFALTHYTIVAGGPRGAADLGLNRQYWGYTTGSLREFLDSRTPRNGAVFFHDTAFDALRLYRADGTIRRDIRWGTTEDAQLGLVHHEQHMAHVEYEIWERFGTTAPIRVLTHQAVPVVSVYERRRAGPPRQP